MPVHDTTGFWLMAVGVGALLVYGVITLVRKLSGIKDGPTKGHWE